jgi:hypothetical protein
MVASTRPAGTSGQAWSIVRALIEHLLATGQQVTGLADILATAVDVAHLANARSTVSALDTLASKRGSSRQLVQARRLSALVTQSG